jgi:putative sigma-54 modulation protein
LDIIVKTKNCDVPNRLKEEATDKIEHATRFFDRLTTVEVVFGEENNSRIPERAVVEVTARAKGHHIRAEGAGEDHRTAIDVAAAKFTRQLARYKARLVDRRKGGKAPAGLGRSAATADLGTPQEVPGTGVSSPDGEGPSPRIVRTKRFELQAMLPEDAAFQLELLGHDFYVFTNAATGGCNVLYRRRDGDLGLIDTVM